MSSVNVNSEINPVGGENIAPAQEVSGFQLGSDQPVRVKITLPSLKNATFEHVLRKPTFEEEEARERATPLVTLDKGKIDVADGEKADASSMTLDTEPANVKLYDKIIQTVKGYGVPGFDKGADVPATTPITTADGEEYTVRDLIPSNHKATVIDVMFPSFSFEVEVEDEEFTFALGAGREWTLKQEIGGRTKQEDGSLSDPDHVIRYIFREPTEAERKKFRSSAIIALTLRTKDGIREQRTSNLRVISELFDDMIVRVEGAVVGDDLVDVRNRVHLKAIPAQFKKNAIIRLFGFLEADLGN